MKDSSKTIELNKLKKIRLKRFPAHSRFMSTSGHTIHFVGGSTLRNAFREALGSSLDVQGTSSRLRTIKEVRLCAEKKVRDVSDAEAIGADWEQTGSDLRKAIKSYNHSENRMRTSS